MIKNKKTIKHGKLLLVVLMNVGLFYSCVPTKDLKEANTNMPSKYVDQTTDSTNSAQLKWSDFFKDENLTKLIDTALTNNQELRIMMQQIDVAQNEVKARKGEYLPFISYGAGAEVEKVGEYTRNGAVEKNLDIKDGEEFPEPLTDYSAGLFATWELDVWKKLRNSKKAAALEYLSTIEGKNFMVTRLIAEIADSYYELVALDNQLAFIEQNLELQSNALKMVRLQKEAARATELAVKRFEAEVLKNQSHKFEVQQEIVEMENKLNFLIGRQPQSITRNSEGFIETEMDTIYAGLPSQLLLNRPDIRQAEFELEAAKLNIKVARANFYPSIGLKAGLGLQAFKPKYLTETPASLIYSAVGDIAGPLINRNAIKADYNTANSKQIQAVFEYEKAILSGYIEVVNQLSKMENLKQSYALKENQVKALTESIDLSTRLFQSARIEYIEVLLTQREALESKMELVETKKDQLMARVNVYQALGGGWN
ncbi:NodT family efflux transporter outer membrane factor (OMF) lipoprotein [Maribacter spongiicola]|uniref:NodT family efflux transporter outer membrane factor (OMF) lipoprotein n=1 Tax=Maribacter spongiicola TaxID=1206753 RepID=A0A4R7K5J3_9FLAO|nr:TolC family protein [Maribacter spongiicola]TDT46131.1 NodT family efflux transporter outer membrane factor (OMF) lipoprotein [Maribacter spongiicola]